MTELAAIARTGNSDIGEVSVKAAAAAAYIQVLVTEGLQYMVSSHSKNDRVHAFDGRLALGFHGKPAGCLSERQRPWVRLLNGECYLFHGG